MAMVDATEITVEALSSALAGVVVSTEIPDPRPTGAYVCVALDSAQTRDFIQTADILLAVWHDSDAQAQSLAMDCVHAMSDACADSPYLSHSQLSSMQRDEWGHDGISRYRVILNLTINDE